MAPQISRYHRDLRRTVAFLFLGFYILSAREYGPPVGAKMPAFELPDQDGHARSLANVLGPKGALIVFYRSADW
jgi:hypothetical protein